MTNFDTIKQMSISDLTELLAYTDSCEMCVLHYKGCKFGRDCLQGIKQWLEAETAE